MPHFNNLDKKLQIITLLGDSTIDNKFWVNELFGAPQLSVVENLIEMLPEHVIHDYSRDGFTTQDVLNGAYEDKVLAIKKYSLYPHEFLQPLKLAEESIKKSQYVIVSVGGNNVREFLMEAGNLEDWLRSDFINDNFEKMLAKLRNEYVEIVHRIRTLNNSARIILMTQYYPSESQHDYKIYQFMQELGEILDFGVSSNNCMTVIHEIMKMIYNNIFERIPTENLVVADITSSLNLYDDTNYVCQIEPSGSGGKKIAQMLKFMVSSHIVSDSKIYRFCPEFFGSKNQDQYVKVSNFNNWQPAHPWDLNDSYI
ncbi:MAG: SGNH/GDSL hydrolase family protein [Pseudomonadota bacterium]